MKGIKITLLMTLFFSFLTIGQVTVVKDINTTAGSSGPRSFVKVGSLTFFTGATTEYGTELWYTDGTEAETYKRLILISITY